MGETKWHSAPWEVRPKPTNDGRALIMQSNPSSDFTETMCPILCEWSEADLVAAAPEAVQELEWYKEKAEAMARYELDGNTTAMLAVCTELALDAGSRGNRILAKARGEQREESDG